MFGYGPFGLTLDIAGHGFIKRKSISLKRYGLADCAFRKDIYNLVYIFRLYILFIRTRSS